MTKGWRSESIRHSLARRGFKTKSVKIQEPPRGLKTFELPTNEQLVKLKEGSIVKLIFTDTHGKNGERMWVKITKKLGDGNFEGELDNVPIGLKMKLGDKVKFNAGEIINIEK